MNIALIAHDNKKELMVQFCIAYCGILSGNNLCSTASTGRLISDATGLKVSSYMSRKQGGAQQIAARIAYNEIDLVLFFCDPQAREYADELNLIAQPFFIKKGSVTRKSRFAPSSPRALTAPAPE